MELEEALAKLAEQDTKLTELTTGLTALKAKNEELLTETKTAKQKAKDEATERQRIADEAATKSGDVDALRKSYEAKLAERESHFAAQLSDRDGLILGSTKSDTIRDIVAAAIPGKDKGLRAYVATRIKTEIKDGTVQVTVLDEAGKPSALSVADLKKEIEADAAWADVIEASRASGGGATGGKSGGAAKVMKRADFDALNAVDKAAFMKAGGTLT